MATPTIIDVTPSVGHSGGVLVELTGTNFDVPVDPPATEVPVPEAVPTVSVIFGTTPAREVLVLSSTQVQALSPSLDPFKVQTQVNVDPGTNTLTATNHGLPDGRLVAVSSSGVMPAPLDDAAGYFVVSSTANTLQLAATAGGAPIDLTDAGTGIVTLTSDGYLDVTVANLRQAPARLTSSAQPFALANGETLELLVDGEAQVVTIDATRYADVGNATAVELAADINAQVRRARALALASSLVLEGETEGEGGTLEVTAGTAAAAIGFDAGQTTGSSSTEPRPGESVTAEASFAPVRPDLSQESHLATVVGQMILELRRQVLENVAWTTDTDYDDDTGDQVNLAYLAELPALVLAGVAAPENREHAIHEPEDFPNATGDGFYTTRPPVVVDVEGTLVGVSDNDLEMLNLLQAVRMFFRKNPFLFVPRQYGNPARGEVKYELEASMGSQVQISPQGDNSNVQFFAVDWRVIGVRLEDMPGLPAAELAGVPVEQCAEPIVATGKTATDVELSLVTKPSGTT